VLGLYVAEDLFSCGSLVCADAEKRDVCFVLWGNLREGEHLEELGADGTIILKRIVKK
jgi:hypothetical protein